MESIYQGVTEYAFNVCDYNVVRFSDPYSVILRLFWLILCVQCMRMAITQKDYCLLLIEGFALFADLLGLRIMDKYFVYDVGASAIAVILCDLITLDCDLYNLPVYLCYSKKSMIFSKTILKDLPGVKHWCVMVNLRPGRIKGKVEDKFQKHYIIFHGKGTIFKRMVPSSMSLSKVEVCDMFRGFQRLGMTSKSLVISFLKKSVNNSFTCQQYSNFVCQCLLVPASTVENFYGRFTYYIIYTIIVTLVLVNLFVKNSFLNSIDLNIVFALFMMIDYALIHTPGSESKTETTNKKLGSVVRVIVFLYLYLSNTVRFNGYFAICGLMVYVIMIYLILPFKVPPFEPTTRKTRSRALSQRFLRIKAKLGKIQVASEVSEVQSEVNM